MESKLSYINNSLNTITNNPKTYLNTYEQGHFGFSDKKEVQAAEVFRLASKAIKEATRDQFVTAEQVENLKKSGKAFYDKYHLKTNNPWRDGFFKVISFIFNTKNPYKVAKDETAKAYQAYIADVDHLTSFERVMSLQAKLASAQAMNTAWQMVQKSTAGQVVNDIRTATQCFSQGYFALGVASLLRPTTILTRSILNQACRAQDPHFYYTLKALEVAN